MTVVDLPAELEVVWGSQHLVIVRGVAPRFEDTSPQGRSHASSLNPRVRGGFQPSVLHRTVGADGFYCRDNTGLIGVGIIGRAKLNFDICGGTTGPRQKAGQFVSI
jgi:hypothetical protein